ncbi:hypothetical protein ACF058_26745 [Streptomyces sp. NPDC015501]|uniref:hypothetical protein n=1 Tax=unclassified Streptomyces TaxID=2593676 RepID=UPI0011A9EC68|nr:hypothetical protein A3L22_17785 [Streptomyces griseus subsp. griseus]
MAASAEPVTPVPVAGRGRGKVVGSRLTTTGHQEIGHLHLITSFSFLLFGDLLALLMRAEPPRRPRTGPRPQLVHPPNEAWHA